MGKKMRINIDIVNDKVNDLIGAMANIAFLNGKPSPSELDWSGSGSVTKHSVTLDTTGLVDCSVVETFPKQVADGEGVTITINPASGMSLASASYKIGSSGTPVNVNITNNAAVITLTNITADITVYLTAVASDTFIGTAYDGVRIDGKTEGGVNFAELVTGPAEPYSVSPLFDLGANRTEPVDIFFTVGAVDTTCSILLFNSDKVYVGQVGANSASGRTYSVPTELRFVRFCFKTQYKSAASMSIGNEEVFNGDTYDGVWGDYKDFRLSQFCPQPNANGDYVGWVPIYKGELYVTGRNEYGNIDNVNLNDARSASDQSWQTRIGSAAALASKAIPYTITKQLNIPTSHKYTFRLTDANNLNPATGMPFSCLQLYSEVNGVVSDQGKLTITTSTTNNQDGSRTIDGNNFQGQTYSRLVIKTEHYNNAYYHDDTTKSVAQDTNNEHYLWENFS